MLSFGKELTLYHVHYNKVDLPKFKAFTDNINASKMMGFAFDMTEKIMGEKREKEMLVTSIFSFSSSIFKKLLSRVSKTRDYIIEECTCLQ